MTSAIAIIPARGGSKRIPRKNIREFNHRPMISYPIQEALNSNLFNKVIVSTDDQEIAGISQEYGAEVPFMRPTELSDDNTATAPVISHALLELRNRKEEFDYACCIYACTPMLTKDDLEKLYIEIRANKSHFAYPIIEYKHPIQRALSINRESKPTFREKNNELTRTQDLETYYHDAGQFYWGKTEAWIEGLKMHTDGIAIPIDSWRLIDIDNEDDWKRAELFSRLI